MLIELMDCAIIVHFIDEKLIFNSVGKKSNYHSCSYSIIKGTYNSEF